MSATTGATEMFWTATDGEFIACIGATEDGRLFDYTLRNAYPVRPYEPGSAIVPLATHNALVAFANAEAAYRAARNGSAGFETEWRAREAAWEELGKVGRG